MATASWQHSSQAKTPFRGLSLVSWSLEATAQSLSPAAVLPEQLYGLSTPLVYSPAVQALMRAVLDDALECWRKQFQSKSRRVQRLAREAEEWMLSEEANWPFSFVNICFALGLEPGYVRRRLRYWRQSPPVISRRARGHAVAKQRPLQLAA